MKKKKVRANLLTNICLKFQVDILKTVDVVNATDQPTNHLMTPIYPPNFVCGGIKRPEKISLDIPRQINSYVQHQIALMPNCVSNQARYCNCIQHWFELLKYIIHHQTWYIVACVRILHRIAFGIPILWSRSLLLNTDVPCQENTLRMVWAIFINVYVACVEIFALDCIWDCWKVTVTKNRNSLSGK
jgi:hypothetical protein